ncbi:ExbD/TolR family protein [Flavobacterium foetidum]|uniref:ExbD/TolR family protein n=1 Tax=Flavobacterium foetidum TaxID=2026681 RepID=UPI001075817E|nr:biopolymer transporter ExbD [Flavobacterium foetidum]KAF2513948.1 biopolymer transporter ExbD [Flavobacterium foetidum]
MKNLPQKVRSRKLNSRVDLTAMVSVSFLLIIFFMVVGELSKPKIMDLSLPDNEWTGTGNYSCYKGVENRIITIMLDENDEIIMHKSIFDYPEIAPKKIEFGSNGIRKELKKIQTSILNYSASMGKPNRGAIVIVKPSKKSNFKNLVDILDEIAIAGIDTYSIVNDFSLEEEKLLASN